MKEGLLKRYTNSFDIKDIVLILFFASRAYTALFGLFLGTKGIYVSMAVLAMGYLIAIVSAFKKKEYNDTLYFLILFFVITIMVLITAIINPFIKEWMLNAQYGIITKIFDVRKAIFATFVILLVKDNKRIIRNMELSAFITFVYMLVQIGLFLHYKSWINYYMVRDENLVLHKYNMSLGYELIFVSIVFLSKAYRESSFKSYLIGVLAFYLAFYYGSRGILLPILGFLALTLVFNSTKKEKFKLVKYTILTVIGFVIFINVLGFVEVLLDSNGIDSILENESPIVGVNDKSRNLEMLVSNDFTAPNGREVIYSLALDAIKDKFPLGYGVYGDRPFIGDRFRWGYSHNFFLEMVVSFGIFGLMLIFGLIYFTLRLLIKKEYSEYKELLIILLAMNAKLLISDTFWHYDFFWAFIGVFLIIFTINKKHRPKFLTYLVSSLLVLNILFLGIFIKVDMKRQKYRTLDINNPTVVLTFDVKSDDNYEMYEILKDRGLKGTCFIDIDKVNSENYLEENTLKDMANYGWDFQDLIGEDSSLDQMSKEELRKLFENKRSKYLDFGLKEPKAIAPSNGEIKLDTTLDILHYKNAIRLKGRKRSVYYYTELKGSDFYKLNALNIKEHDEDIQKNMMYIKNQIDIAKKKNALLILYIEDSNSNNKYNKEEKIEYFKEIVSYLIVNDFDFKTLDQIMTLAEIPAEEMTLGNYLKNNVMEILSN